MKDIILKVYKEFMQKFKEVEKFNFTKNYYDLFFQTNFLDSSVAICLETYNEIFNIDFQDKRMINNLLGSKRFHLISILDYFNNFRKEVNHETLRLNFNAFVNANILGLEYLVINLDSVGKDDRMLVYYVLKNTEIIFNITSTEIKWRTINLLTNLDN